MHESVSIDHLVKLESFVVLDKTHLNSVIGYSVEVEDQRFGKSCDPVFLNAFWMWNNFSSAHLAYSHSVFGSHIEGLSYFLAVIILDHFY